MSDYKLTRDAAGKITTQYSQMLQRLEDEQEDEWHVCVSCGGPAKGDFCGFCLEEE